MNVTPPHITSLAPNEIFVYGANRAWRHGAGAARTALKWGAKHGVGPFSGQTYGICTKDDNIQTLSRLEIWEEVKTFLIFAAQHQQSDFLVTAIGCGLAGYAPADIAPLFHRVPANVSLPQSFIDVLNA